jgi:NADH:ubiquinone oxidoreductase subunit H
MLCFLLIVLPVLIAVAYLTLAERKIMGSMQQRKGPNVVGFFGPPAAISGWFKTIAKRNYHTS